MTRISSALWRYSSVFKGVLGVLLRFRVLSFYRKKKFSFHLTKNTFHYLLELFPSNTRGVLWKLFCVIQWTGHRSIFLKI